jgi:hypothetical protein
VEYIFVIHDVTGVKLMAESFPWTVVLLAVSTILQKPLISVIDEFASVKGREVKL